MARKIDPRDAAAIKGLQEALDHLGADGVLYRLCEEAVRRRNAASGEDGNPAEERYWQRVLQILSDAQDEVEGIE